jgi:hypothetical protein
MAALYRLSREGGPRSERFRAYVTHVEHEWGLVAYNPMAGEAAQQTVDALLGMGAESIVADAAASVMELCHFDEQITLAIAVRSRGMWTDRLATEIEVRASPVQAPRNHGLVALWSREPLDPAIVRRESVAEAVRVMSTALHGSARTVAEFVHREGLAYSLGGREVAAAAYAADEGADGSEAHPHFIQAPPPADGDAISQIIDILADSTAFSDVAGCLFGDPACEAMGWPRLGIPENGGYAWAVQRASRQIDMLGPAAALREAMFPGARQAASK